MITLIYAHPYPQRSRANRLMLEAAAELPFVSIRSLYDLYPDFSIDVETEQRALQAADTIVWQHPLYWYSSPPLLKLWFDKVLAYGWAYGDDAQALRGKRCQWAVTTGGDPGAFDSQGMHGYTFDHFVTPVEQTAKFCGMLWQAPFVVHGAHRVSHKSLSETADAYRERLRALQPGLVTQEAAHG